MRQSEITDCVPSKTCGIITIMSPTETNAKNTIVAFLRRCGANLNVNMQKMSVISDKVANALMTGTITQTIVGNLMNKVFYIVIV